MLLTTRPVRDLPRWPPARPNYPYRTPLKHLRYPLRKETPVTLAAGFALGDGLLLCADTLYTDGLTKEYRDKIFVWAGKHAAVAFAIAGHATIARMAVEECRQKLSDSKSARLSTSRILSVVRPVIKMVYEQYVDTRPFEERAASDFWMLIGITAESERPRLFASMRASLAPVDTFDCIGCGRHLGRYVIESGFRNAMTIDEATVLSIQALAAAKERADGVGGRSQFIAIRGEILSPIVGHDVNLSEGYALHFRECVTSLLMDLTNGSVSDDQFAASLQSFGAKTKVIRELWRNSAASWESMSSALKRRADLLSLQSTTHDRSYLPASRE
jgi:20S proteasome alpha/beta subunit